jgi:hypothetical protein
LVLVIRAHLLNSLCATEAVPNTTTATPAAPPAATVAPGNAGFLHFAVPWIASNLYGVVPLAPLTAVPDHGEKWFAITRGKYVGLTTNFPISLNAVTGVPSSLSDKFTTQGEALQHFNEALGAQAVAILA